MVFAWTKVCRPGWQLTLLTAPLAPPLREDVCSTVAIWQGSYSTPIPRYKLWIVIHIHIHMHIHHHHHHHHHHHYCHDQHHHHPSEWTGNPAAPAWTKAAMSSALAGGDRILTWDRDPLRVPLKTMGNHRKTMENDRKTIGSKLVW